MYRELLFLAGENKDRLKITLILMSLYGLIKTLPLAFLYFIILELLEPSVNINRVSLLSLLIIISYIFIHIIDYRLFLRSMKEGLIMSYDLRMKLGDKLTKLSLGFFTDRSKGELNTTLGEYVSRIEYFITYMAPYLLTSLMSFFVLIIIFLILDWRLAMVSLSLIPLIWLAFRYSDKISEKVKQKREKSLFRLNAMIVEFIEGISDIKIFNQEFNKIHRFRETVEDFRDRNIRNVSVTMIPNIILLIFSSMLIVVVLPTGLYLYFGGALEIKTLIFFLIATPMVSESLAHYLYGYIHVKHSVGQAMEHIIKILKRKGVQEPSESKPLEKFDIEFENVSFSYNQEPLIKNISFKVPEKSVTAMVGPSGAGKSTIANLILRFWDVDAGRVKIGGYDVKDIDIETLFSCVSIIFQDVILFNNTVKENIRIGKKDATDEEVLAAAKAARCHEFVIKLPEGYDTTIGEKGTKLSEGEKQRISIARAILKDAPILILDEATVYIDPANEKMIQEAINELIYDKTVLIIAHRLSTIKAVDQIIVMKNGRIIEKGKHEELIAKNGFYRRLWETHKRAMTWKI
ncbi:putative ABC transporter permease and ATP-binding subunit [Methanothermobacter sp. CaT2]|uniref:ABC transporter ATP-binding protein n=1 Tax=Methanothermobacter TaxID=145260 RepID=UPI0002CCE968|nr:MULTISPECIES: ABC transporter ATP-binding protein [Methanothermobacter]MDI6817936.1 ABC transporter ATP-binding protein [Methanothermobacter thermautotrophicus]WBF08660.1 ABC transporter ATP-binding protein [Methanothermobacter thermautotrophicus]BAM69792.1 putative ABC transporter permease and ATP-binding subunit [Methanothermobacter sp. CaT2]